MNDLPEHVKNSTVRLFADDCILYRPIKSIQDCHHLQSDLDALARWETDWLMEFNSSKCFSMSVSTSRNPIQFTYTLHNQPLQIVHTSKYLGITISDDLKWNSHINNISGRANRLLGLLRRNLKINSVQLKDRAYQAIVRPQLDYASSVWDPHTAQNIKRLEAVQRRGARFVHNRWHNTSRVTPMLQSLDWEPLASRRANTRLCMFYRIVHSTVAIPANEYLTLSSTRTRKSHAWIYQTTFCSRDIHKYSFFPCTIVLWNALPAVCVDAQTLEQFKTLLPRASY